MNKYLVKFRALLLFVCPAMFAFALPFVKPVSQTGDFYGQFSQAQAYNILLNQQGELNDYQGKYTYLFLGFQGCSQACPRQLLNLAALADDAALQAAQFLYIDLVVSAPQQAFSSAMLNKVEFRQVADFQQSIEVSQRFPGYVSTSFDQQVVDHSAYLYLLNPLGEVSLVYTQQNLDISQVVTDFKLLQQGDLL
ncbi:hypothetical protein F9L16_08765 [Agarivorans sp. B2Z047]|uniref:SCO family protein n=1 Tax=Agarivorans sp. B2Z047 TaxID=2652721 RepID=UPI00128C528F|nr:SCO family protein [Agarivorans sp. B2Z047]MPW29086.1 hypothetical protein [Agarivorans sp. B2Z047]UQN41639.1 SCO family protein [Agarivorans sp. B2Z047]